MLFAREDHVLRAPRRDPGEAAVGKSLQPIVDVDSDSLREDSSAE
jgi:hypothetical protein